MLEEGCVMSSINLAETLDVLARRHGVGIAEQRAVVGPLLADAVEVDSPAVEDAWAVATLRARYYRRSTRELSLADCFLLAAAARRRLRLATADPAVAATARDEAIELIPLPDSAGRRP